jgi:hypothetical protein
MPLIAVGFLVCAAAFAQTSGARRRSATGGRSDAGRGTRGDGGATVNALVSPDVYSDRTVTNAVKTQIWIAVSVYVLVAIVRKRLGLDASLYQIPHRF